MDKPLDKLTPEEVAFYRARKDRIEKARLRTIPSQPVAIGSN